VAIPEVSVQQVEKALQRLPAKRLKEALLFIEFLEYLGDDDDDSEDADLWKAVLAHQAYRESHPHETPEVFDSPQGFLNASVDL
jgi:hypothetical protein